VAQDENARVAVEVFATDGKILVAGEVTSKAKVNYKAIVWDRLRAIKYKSRDLSSKLSESFDIEVRVHAQSPDIARAVDARKSSARRSGNHGGLCDQ
jgi:S-adenosylmethionine synthetase